MVGTLLSRGVARYESHSQAANCLLSAVHHICNEREPLEHLPIEHLSNDEVLKEAYISVYEYVAYRGHIMNLHKKTTLDFVKYLLRAGVPIDSTDKAKQTVLMHAVRLLDPDVVSFRLGAGANIDAQDSYGQTALHIAAQISSLAICPLLLERGADINIQNHRGQTVLHIVNQKSDSESTYWLHMMNVLLESNPDRSPVDCNGSTAIDLVMNSDNGFRKFYFNRDLEGIEFIYRGEDVDDISLLLRQFKTDLKLTFNFPAVARTEGEGDGYILEAELAAEVLGDTEQVFHYSVLRTYWPRVIQLGYDALILSIRLTKVPRQYRNDPTNEDVYECIRLLPGYGVRARRSLNEGNPIRGNESDPSSPDALPGPNA